MADMASVDATLSGVRQAQPHLPIAEADRARRVWSQLAVISRSYMLRIEKVYVMLLKNAIVFLSHLRVRSASVS